MGFLSMKRQRSRATAQEPESEYREGQACHAIDGEHCPISYGLIVLVEFQPPGKSIGAAWQPTARQALVVHDEKANAQGEKKDALENCHVSILVKPDA